MKQRNYNNEMNIIDTEEKAYLLGLLMADGGLFYNKTSGAYQTKLKLKKSDKEILIKIQNEFPFFTEPRLEKAEFGAYCIYRYNKQLFLDLKNNGILERKSYENANNVFLPNSIINSKLFLFNYLRGLFDGDGSIYEKNKSMCIQFLGTEKLIKEIITVAPAKKKTYHFRGKNGGANVYCLYYSSKEDAKNIYDWMYKDSNIYLDRKYNKFQEFL